MKIGIKPLAQKVAARVQKWAGSRASGSSVAGGSGFLSLFGFDGPGGWFQQDSKADSTGSLLEFSAVYSCLTLLAKDISKLPMRLVSLTEDGIWKEVQSPAYSPVLRKPNNYQTRIQFLSAWVVSKLIHGNTYVLLERDARGVVSGMHILDPRLVTVLVAPNGDVYYQLNSDDLAKIHEGLTVPSREIIHDRAECLHHPLIGVAPLVAAAMSATHGRRIQGNSVKFFANMSRPSGMLTAPETIEQETADRLKAEFEKKFSGDNIGRLFVAGDGLKYEPMNIPAIQSQLIEQLKWTGEDIARCFHVPAYKIGLGEPPTFNNISTLQQDYYNTALHTLIECIELLLDEGLGLTKGVQTLGVELDIGVLLRLDPESLAKTVESGVKSGVMSPNEGRARMNLPPVAGGQEVYMQQQMWPLRALERLGMDSPEDAPPSNTPPPAPSTEDQAAKLIQAISEGSRTTAERVERALSDAMTGERLRTAESMATQARADAQEHAAIAEKAAADLAAARAEIAAMEQRAADAQSQASRMADEAERLRVDADAFKSSAVAAQAESAILSAAADRARAEAVAAESKAQEAIRSGAESVGQLKAEAASLREKAEQAERLASLQADLANESAREAASAASVNADLMRKVESGDAEIAAVRRRVDELLTEAAEAAQRVADADAKAASAESRLSDAQAFAASIEAESEARFADVARLSAEAASLRADVDASKAVADDARAQVESYAAEVERARLNASEVEAIAAAEAEAAADHLASLQAEADALRMAADDLRAKAGESDERAAAELAEADRVLSALKAQIEDERSKADALNLRVSELQEAAKTADEGACTHRYNLDVIRNECEARTSKAQEAATAAEQKAEEAHARSMGLERLATEQSGQIERLLIEVRQARENAQSAYEAESKARQMAEDLQDRTEELASAKQNAESLDAARVEAERVAQSAVDQVRAANDQIEALKAQLAEATKPKESQPDANSALAKALIARIDAATETRS